MMEVPSEKDNYYFYSINPIGIYVDKRIGYSSELLWILLKDFLNE
ncbi:hypothetical protein [Alkaliphilus serpentinus]|nr:hypothetical protein [Alkaliphilus serpentinus]